MQVIPTYSARPYLLHSQIAWFIPVKSSVRRHGMPVSGVELHRIVSQVKRWRLASFTMIPGQIQISEIQYEAVGETRRGAASDGLALQNSA